DRTVHHLREGIDKFDLDLRRQTRSGVSVGGQHRFYMGAALRRTKRLDRIRIRVIDENLLAGVQLHGEPFHVCAASPFPPQQAEWIKTSRRDDKVECRIRGAPPAVEGTEDQPEWIGSARSHGDLESIVAVQSHPVATG